MEAVSSQLTIPNLTSLTNLTYLPPLDVCYPLSIKQPADYPAKYLQLFHEPSTIDNTDVKAMLKLEKAYLNSLTYDHDYIDRLNKQLFQLDSELLFTHLNTNKTLVPDLHHNLANLLTAITSNVSNLSAVKYWLNPGQSLNPGAKPSAEGMAFSPNLLNTNIIVAKVAQNSNNSFIIHEALVGTVLSKYLRSLVPNFTYVYGYTQCSGAFISSSSLDNQVTWCQKAGRNEYLLMENVVSGQSFRKLMTTTQIKSEDLLAIIYQIFNALALAHHYFKYTHHDLHAENVIIRKFDEVQIIPIYEYQGELKVKHYLQTQYIAYIIDYGFSYIEVDGLQFRRLDITSMDVTTSLPLRDILIFIKNINALSDRQHDPVIKEISEVLERFSMQKQAEFRVSTETRKYNFQEFLIFLTKAFDMPVIDTVNPQELLALQVMTSSDFIQTFMKISKIPETGAELIFALRALSDNEVREKQWLHDHFPLTQYLSDTMSVLETLGQQIFNLAPFKANSLMNKPVSELNKVWVWGGYRNGLKRLVEEQTLVDNYREQLMIYTRVLRFFEDQDIPEISEDPTVTEIALSQEQARDVYLQDAEYLGQLSGLVNNFWKAEYPGLIDSL